jgi:DNA-directed RNA polymerase specialized sigma24 family protein
VTAEDGFSLRAPLNIARPPSDAFPTTLLTTLVERLRGNSPNALVEIHSAIMTRYAKPLEIYARGSSLREIAEPAELVHGFFASALASPAFFERYQASGMRLRRWLMNGLLLHARSVARDRTRAARREGATLDGVAAPIAAERTGEEAFDRAWALAILSEACAAVEGALLAEGRDRAWTVFRRHAIDGRSYGELEQELGLGRQQMADLVRSVTKRLRERMLELLESEGGDVAEELREVLRLVT